MENNVEYCACECCGRLVICRKIDGKMLCDRCFAEYVSQPTIKDYPTVWVVSWYNAGEEPVVTVFDNEENAMKCYNYELANSHIKVAIDECPIYNTFMYCPQNSET